MPAYAHYVPFIISDALRWSFKAMPESAAERWQSYVATMPTDQMLKHLVINDFRGIYIDLRGYNDDDGYMLINEIQSITGADYIICDWGVMVYFYIGDFSDYINSVLSERERLRYSWDVEFPTIAIDELITADIRLHGLLKSGWGEIEDWGVWSILHTAEIAFSLELEDFTDLKLDLITTVFPDPTNFSIHLNDMLISEYSLPRGNHEISIPFNTNDLIHENGIYLANIRFKVENPQSPSSISDSTDHRSLGVGLKDIQVRQG
jgi:hypothetical protein